MRVARAAAGGVPIRHVAAQYNVSASFIWRMQKLFKDTNDVTHKQFGGYKWLILAEYRTVLAGESPRTKARGITLGQAALVQYLLRPVSGS